MPPSHTNNKNKMTRLGDFTGKIYKHVFGPNSSDGRSLPFTGNATKDHPTLRPRGVNRILLYPGSFNPPHRGHWTLLEHVFNNAGDDLQLKAVILLPTDDTRLTVKTYKDPEALIIPRRQRVQLWNEANVLTNQMWVFERSEKDWTVFRGKLEDEFSKAGLDVKFIVLTGPDYISQSSTTDSSHWNCKDTITSDISRPVNFITDTGELQRVYPCSQWQRPRWDKERLEVQFRARMRGQDPEDVQKAVGDAAAKMERIWICHRLMKPRGTIRFIWTGQSSRQNEAPSSTEIRGLMRGYPNELQERRLDDLALSPRLLAQFVQKYSPNPELQKLQEDMRDRAARKAERDWSDDIAW